MPKPQSRNRKLLILLVEDDPHDIELMNAQLVVNHIECDVVAVDRESTFVSELQRKPDLILSDMNVLRLDGLSALTIATKKCPHTPFVFLSGTIREETRAQAFAGGAADIVLKNDIGQLVSVIRRLCQVQDDEG